MGAVRRGVVVVAGLTAMVVGPATTAPGYTVKRGDTLWRLALRHRVPVEQLAAANRLDDPHRIHAGSVLRIPPPARPAKGGPPPRARGPAPARPSAPPELARTATRRALVPEFERWAAAYRIPPDLLKALTWWESGWQNHVVSDQGARGIGQLMPDTVRFVNSVLLGGARLDPARPADNIRLSARFLRYLLDQTGGRTDQAVAAYYQGLASVRSRPLLPDTRRYVAGVLALRQRF